MKNEMSVLGVLSIELRTTSIFAAIELVDFALGSLIN